jgi:hypothetical protein
MSVVTQSFPERKTPGFGCPHCGAPLDLLREDRMQWGLRCCGYGPTGIELARLMRARRLLIDLRDGTADNAEQARLELEAMGPNTAVDWVGKVEPKNAKIGDWWNGRRLTENGWE